MPNLDIRRQEQMDALQRVMDNPAGLPTAGIAAGAVTPPKMAFTGLKFLACVGANGAGSVVMTGAAVGDRVVGIFGTVTASAIMEAKVPGTDFEAAITVVNAIQQIAIGDLTGRSFIVILAPPTA